MTDISIITPVFNGADTIQQTVDSVLCQQGVKIEHIVEDGVSTDNTVEILESIDDDRLRWRSRPDDGVYDAMNQGIKKASGEWLLFLGANDRLIADDVLAKALELHDGKAQVLLGHAQYDSGDYWKSRLGRGLIAKNTVHHQGTLYHHELFRHKQFDEELNVYGDYEFNLHLLHADIQKQRIDLLISQCANDGLSDTPRLKNYLEQIRVRHQYYPLWQAVPYDVLTIGRFLGKKLLK